MLDTFKARLKAKAKALGVNLSQKRIDAYADRLHKKNPDLTEEKDHDEKLDELLELVDLKEIAKDDDRLRTLDKKDKTPPADDQDNDDDDDSEPVKPVKKVKKDKAVDETQTLLKTVLEKLNKLESKEAQQSISEKVAASDKLKDVPKSFWNKRSLPEKEEDIETFVDEIATDYSAFEQDLTTKGLLSQTKPVLGTVNKEGVSSEVASYIESRTKPEKAVSDLGGKKI